MLKLLRTLMEHCITTLSILSSVSIELKPNKALDEMSVLELRGITCHI